MFDSLDPAASAAIGRGPAVDPAGRVDDDSAWIDRRARRDDADAWCASSSRGVIATANYQATAAGAAMFARGGNAIDAAVAAAFALGVVEPAGSGIGGMATALVSRAGQAPLTVEGACRAPNDASPERVAASPSRYRGYAAIAVPMQVAVMDHLLREFGTLSHDVVLGPAIDLADRGCTVGPVLHALLEQYRSALGHPSVERVFTAGGSAPDIGSTLRQPALARTLRRLADAGLRDFYEGVVAEAIAEDMARNAGFIGRADLDGAKPHIADPIVVPYGDGSAATAGPPAGGLALAQMLLAADRLGGIALSTDAGVALCADLIRRVRQDRRSVRKAIGARELAGAAALLDEARIDRLLRDLGHPRPGETTHISAMDHAGNAIGLTQSIERSFGAAVIGEQLGFLYNGYLRGFKLEAVSHPHYLRPGAIARSNAAPTIFVDPTGPIAVIGSTGSERMASGILTTVLRLADGNAFDAVYAPRFHCTPEGRVMIERRLRAACESLVGKGFSIQELDEFAFAMGGLQLAVRQGDRLVAVADPRRDGAAAGAGLETDR